MGDGAEALPHGRGLVETPQRAPYRGLQMAKKSSGSSKSSGKSRSAITGRYVKKSYAKSHPKTTVTEKK